MKIIDKIKKANRACLVLQGGAMRGSYTTGALQVFEEMGLRKHFKYIIGESAGALNGAYFKTGQGTFDDGFGIYANHLCTTDFIDIKGFPKILDIDYLVDVVLNKQQLNRIELAKDDSELFVAATDLETMEPKVFSSKSIHIEDAIFASMAVPIFWGGNFEIEGRSYIDGGLSLPVTYQYALDHIDADLFVVIVTNSEGYRYNDTRLKTAMLSSNFIESRYPRQLLSRLKNSDTMYNSVLRRVENDSHYYANVEALFPSNQDRLVNMLEIRKDKVLDTQRMGHQDAQFFLNREVEKKSHMIIKA